MPERRSVSSMISQTLISKPRMLRAEPLRQLADHVVVLARLAERFDHLAGHLERRVSARGVEVVVLEERRGRQHHVGERRSLGHELLVHAGEQILAREARVHLVQLRADHRRVGVLDQQSGHRRAAFERLGVAGENRAETRLIELAHGTVDHVQTFDQRAVERIDAGVAVERAAARMLPRAGDRRAGRRPRACSPRRCASARSRDGSECKLRLVRP